MDHFELKPQLQNKNLFQTHMVMKIDHNPGPKTSLNKV